MGQLIDMTGKAVGRLTAIGRAPAKPGRQAMWRCRCVCGQTTIVPGGDLRSGRTASCGCGMIDARTKHDACQTPEYNCWRNMKHRCDPAHASRYPRYSGRGIRVCERWADNFEAFLADLGPRPSPHHSIDRIDNDGDYEPGNCRWATAQEQTHSFRGQRNHHAKLTRQRVQEIRRAYAQGASRAQLAREHGASWSNVHRIVTRQSWRHV